MKSNCTVTSELNCSLERAFKTPILGDATKFFPKYFGLVGFADDETWGREGGSRIPLVKSVFRKIPKRTFFDQVIKREENKYWNWRISEFKNGLKFLAIKSEGEWFVSENKNGFINVKYSYTFTSKNKLIHPFTWYFTKIFWNFLMRKAIKQIKILAETEAPYIYDK